MGVLFPSFQFVNNAYFVKLTPKCTVSFSCHFFLMSYLCEQNSVNILANYSTEACSNNDGRTQPTIRKTVYLEECLQSQVALFKK